MKDKLHFKIELGVKIEHLVYEVKPGKELNQIQPLQHTLRPNFKLKVFTSKQSKTG